MMQTKILKCGDEKIAAEILKNDGLVALPTETVYGLGANALSENAVKKIFVAKGRPSDNPLILHISEVNEIYDLITSFPEKAKILTKKFWPGPLTVILPKSKYVSKATSGGLKTVAIRLPSHPTMRKVIKYLGFPVAAPSANISGKPSPTKFSHVLKDMNGKIDAIFDGGGCQIGLESTVISFVDKSPRLLRPGKVTVEQIEGEIGKIIVDPAIMSDLKPTQKVISPGMKYKHYAPDAKVLIIDAPKEKYIEYVNSHRSPRTLSLCFDEDIENICGKCLSFGKENDFDNQANLFFDALRKIDNMHEIELVLARCPKKSGVSLAVYNRLIRAAGFEVISLE